MTCLSPADWLNFSIASIDAEKTFIGLCPGKVDVNQETALQCPGKKTTMSFTLRRAVAKKTKGS